VPLAAARFDLARQVFELARRLTIRAGARGETLSDALHDLQIVNFAEIGLEPFDLQDLSADRRPFDFTRELEGVAQFFRGDTHGMQWLGRIERPCPFQCTRERSSTLTEPRRDECSGCGFENGAVEAVRERCQPHIQRRDIHGLQLPHHRAPAALANAHTLSIDTRDD